MQEAAQTNQHNFSDRFAKPLLASQSFYSARRSNCRNGNYRLQPFYYIIEGLYAIVTISIICLFGLYKLFEARSGFAKWYKKLRQLVWWLHKLMQLLASTLMPVYSIGRPQHADFNVHLIHQWIVSVSKLLTYNINWRWFIAKTGLAALAQSTISPSGSIVLWNRKWL